MLKKKKLKLHIFYRSSAVQDTKGSSKSFPKHETRHLSEHKVYIWLILNTMICFSLVLSVHQIFCLWASHLTVCLNFQEYSQMCKILSWWEVCCHRKCRHINKALWGVDFFFFSTFGNFFPLLKILLRVRHFFLAGCKN